MASNDERVVEADLDDRRFAIFHVSNKRKGDFEFFAALNAELEDGGLQAMLYDLVHREVGNWHPRINVPKTKAKTQQVSQSLKGFERMMFDYLTSGEIYPVLQEGDRPRVSTRLLREYVQKYTSD